MKAFEKIMNKQSIVKFPGKGICRVPGCEVPYTRTTGRKGMCKTHLYETNKLVKAGEVTWEAVNKEWPEVKPYPYLGPGSAIDRIQKVVSEIHIDQIRFSETEFRNEVIRLMHDNGHGVWQLDATGQRGIPDLLIVTKSGKVLFRELKAIEGRLSEEQEAKIADMLDQGSDVAVWGVADLENGRILEDVSA